MNDNISQEITHAALLSYYRDYFPAKWLCEMLRPEYLRNRTVAFSVKDKKTNFVMRDLIFNNWTDLKNELLKRVPYRIDVGCILSVPPHRPFIGPITSKIGQNALEPLFKELVLDIDMEPPVNWLSIARSVRIIDKTLKDEYGFKDFLFVFSGKKGVHCWVTDNRAMSLDEESRLQIVNRLSGKGVDLDIDASCKINHLLKIPFVVHPETGYICLPFHANELLDAIPDIDNPDENQSPQEYGTMDVEDFPSFGEKITEGGKSISISMLLHRTASISNTSKKQFALRVKLFSDWINSRQASNEDEL